jgi:hypothetical protein
MARVVFDSGWNQQAGAGLVPLHGARLTARQQAAAPGGLFGCEALIYSDISMDSHDGMAAELYGPSTMSESVPRVKDALRPTFSVGFSAKSR